MTDTPDNASDRRAAFDRRLAELRPKLHRYCARMTGSVIDGEDVVQEAVLKAIEALDEAGALANPEGWLFRIAHNAALDFLRRRARQQAVRSDEDLDMIADHATPADIRVAAAASMRTFMRRLTRLCLGFSKKLENLKHAVALFIAHFNFCRKHSAHGVTPARAAGLTHHTWTIPELLQSV